MTVDRRIAWALVLSVLVVTVIATGCTTSSSPAGPAATINPPVGRDQVKQASGGNLTMAAIDVGQGDALLLTFPHNESLLVDGGREVEGSIVVAYLHSLGISHLNGVVATHPDSDHIGGLLTVLNSVKVDRVYDLGLPKSTSTYTALLQLIGQKNVSYTKPRAGDGIAIDSDTTVFVLNPPQSISAMKAADNDDSIVIKVTYQRVSYLLTGDAESAAEGQMISLYNCSSYVLKVGHHGSNSASSASFLRAVAPHIAVISVGANNTYGHPAPQVLARLAAVNATAYRTDLQGTIVVTTNGQTVDVRAARNT